MTDYLAQCYIKTTRLQSIRYPDIAEQSLHLQ